MARADWPESFIAILRKHLPLLDDGTPLTAETSLSDLGLDSMATVRLLVELEEAHDIEFPDEDLVMANFVTPLAVWSLVARLQGEMHHVP